MAWQELTFQVRSSLAETFVQLLEEHQAVAVTLQDAGDQPIYEPPLGTTPVWDETCVTGLFNDGDDVQPLINHITTLYPGTQYQLHTLADQNWERTWMDDFKPMQFGSRLWIMPSFEAQPNQPYQVILDPGLAFGTGKHPTTALCLQWLDAHIKGQETVIDYGCGSGILAIAAIKLGAECVYAVDHDPQALIATQENAARNHISETQLHVSLPDDFNAQPATILIANILAKPLIELAPYFCKLVVKGGAIVLSGILKEQADDVIAAYRPFSEIQQVVTLDEWVRIDLTTRP